MRRGSRAQSGKIRYVCRETTGDRKVCYSTTDPTAPYRDQSGTPKTPDKNPQFRRPLGGIKRFIVTCAQNATPVHEEFFACLQTYAAHNNAELVVIPLRYKNVTSRWHASQENAERWEVDDKYLYNQRKKLNDNLVLVGDTKTQPTAMKPLSRYESMTAGESCIVGHTKIQMMTIPVPNGAYPKILTTTGACTVKNYTDTKAGKVGEFHHALAAVVVEIVGKRFFLRHVNYDEKNQSFIDLDTEYSPEGAFEAPRPLALVFGDTHRAFIDKKVEECTYGSGGMVDTLDPEHLVFHDLHDGFSINHHDRRDPFAQVAKRTMSMHLVEQEIKDDVKWLQNVCAGRQGVIVASNHDDFLARWLREQDWRLDPDNSEFYLESALELVKAIKGGSDCPHPLAYWVDRLKGDSPIRCLKRDESFTLGGVELSLHGDIGPNGTRGNRNNLRRIGVKTIVGHSHSPGIEEGCYQAGTSTSLRLSYNTGPSSWLHAHVVLYANGKRAILPIIDGHWCFDASSV